MAGLFDSLSSATNALTAQRIGLDVVGQNLANVNTVGYTKRTLDLAEVPPADLYGVGRGVEVVGIRALRDSLVEARIRHESQGSASDAAVLDGLTEVEGAIGLPGASLDAKLTAFFDAFSTLATDVTSTAARDGVVQQGKQLAQAFNDLANRLAQSQRDADASIAASVNDVNRLAAQVAHLNQQILNGGPGVDALRDQRDVLLGQLADLTGADVLETQDGDVNVTVGNGRALVIGATSYTLDASPTGPSGALTLSINGTVVTSEITSGRVGGLLTLRDTIIPGYQNSLDQLASDVTTQVNALHTSGFDATGAPGGAFFVPQATVAGSARSFAVVAAVAANSSLVAGSGTGAPGDNQTALAIAALRNAKVMSGGTKTATEAWGQLAYQVGLDVESARASGEARGQIVQQLLRLRDQTSGVSMDEEAAHLMRFQRAYEANARYFTTIVDTIDALMNMVQ